MNRLAVFLLQLLLFFALPSEALPEQFGLFQCAKHFARVEVIRKKSGDFVANLYDRIFFDDGFHPDGKVRVLAFKLLSSARPPEKTLESVISDLENRTPEEIEALVRQLDQLPIAAREVLLGKQSEWIKWANQTLRPTHPLHKNKYISIDGKPVDAEFHRAVTKYQAELKKDGIYTHFVPGTNYALSTDGIRKGRGVLVVDGIDRRILPITHDTIEPGKPILNSAEFELHLKQARRQGGTFIIDPDSTAIGYFWNSNEIVHGRKWVIAINPDLNGSEFAHEWQHKVDDIDLGRPFPNMVSRKKSNKRTSTLGRGLFDFGAYLEDQYIDELSATSRQFQLYFETRSFPPGDVKHTIIYRAQNQKKVAIGRIAMDPLNPKHYLLWFNGALKTYGPIVIPVGLVAAGIIRLLADADESGNQPPIEDRPELKELLTTPSPSS